MGVGFNKNAVSAIITLKYYWGEKDFKKNLSSGVSLIYRAETSFCSQLMEEKGREGKLAPVIGILIKDRHGSRTIQPLIYQNSL